MKSPCTLQEGRVVVVRFKPTAVPIRPVNTGWGPGVPHGNVIDSSCRSFSALGRDNIAMVTDEAADADS